LQATGDSNTDWGHFRCPAGEPKFKPPIGWADPNVGGRFHPFNSPETLTAVSAIIEDNELKASNRLLANGSEFVLHIPCAIVNVIGC